VKQATAPAQYADRDGGGRVVVDLTVDDPAVAIEHGVLACGAQFGVGARLLDWPRRPAAAD
jgi:hypothetical protein